MYPLEDFQIILSRIAKNLRNLRVPFHWTGGTAVIAHAEPRFTQDIDLVVDRQALLPKLPDFVRTFTADGFLFFETTIRASIAAERRFQRLDPALSLKADLYPRELIPGELSRSVEMEVLPDVMLPVACRTDSALSKLIWISKGAHKSRHDLKRILLRATKEEFQTVQQGAQDRNLKTLLDEVLAEPDEFED